MNDLPCPCCGFLTLREAYGSYAICQVCGWEDDGVQLANFTSGGGANLASLYAAQVAALRQFPLAMKELANGVQRSVEWRPLTEAEVAEADRRRVAGDWHSMATVDPVHAYWASSAT